jgi:membrane protease subunit HflC
MTEQVIITQFGMPVGEPVVDAGLHWKTPFIQTVNRIENRVLEWDGEMHAHDHQEQGLRHDRYAFARWEIENALFYRQLT